MVSPEAIGVDIPANGVATVDAHKDDDLGVGGVTSTYQSVSTHVPDNVDDPDLMNPEDNPDKNKMETNESPSVEASV